MLIRMKQDFDEFKAGQEVEIDGKRGIYYQGIGVADVIEHDAPARNAKKSKLVETPQSKALNAVMARKEKPDESGG